MLPEDIPLSLGQQHFVHHPLCPSLEPRPLGPLVQGTDKLPLPRRTGRAGSPATGPGGRDGARPPRVTQLEPMQLGLVLAKRFRKS